MSDENVNKYCIKRNHLPQPLKDDNEPDRRVTTVYGETPAQRAKKNKK